ncbi:hypothetical protein NHQ30_009668 [Ciborinia camelliae]|nr:hypothetical protein NHQ30_009668 [Ciborinia camelliae]
MANQTRDYGDLRVTLTSELQWAWDNNKYGSNRSCCFWNPKPQGNMYPLGSVCVGKRNYSDTNWRAVLLVGNNPNATGLLPAVARPVDYEGPIWSEPLARIFGIHTISVWRPIAPPGYVAMGDVAVNSLNKPSTNMIWCLRGDLTRLGAYNGSDLWDDKGSGRPTDVSIWSIIPESIGINGAEKLVQYGSIFYNPQSRAIANSATIYSIPIFADTFRAIMSYSRPNLGLAAVPQLTLKNDYKAFTASVPDVTPTTIPNTGDKYNLLEQASVSLPFTSYFNPEDSRGLSGIRNPFVSVSRLVAWIVDGVWENKSNSTYSREQRIKYGVSTTQTQEMTHSVGVEVSASGGFKLAEWSVTLNYQFTSSTSSSFNDFTENEVTQKFDVPPKTVTVLFTKHIYVRGARDDGSTIMNEIEIVANNDVHFSGCALP